MRTDPDLVAVRSLAVEPSDESISRTWYSMIKKPRPKPRRRMLVPVAAAAVVAVLAGATPLVYNAGSRTLWPVASSPDAVATLHALADRAALGAPVSIAPGQVVQIDSTGLAGVCGPAECRIEPQDRQMWYDPRTGETTLKETGTKAEPQSPITPGIRYPTLQWLAGLPTEPEQLLRQLRIEIGQHEKWTVDHQLWDAMAQIYFNAEIALSPQQRSAFLRALTGMTGLSVRDLTIDGKPAVAIRHTDSDNGREILFDLGTGKAIGRGTAYLGDDLTVIQMPGGPSLAPGVIYQATFKQSIVDSPLQ